MTLGNFEPLATAAVEDVQVDRTGTRRYFDDTDRRGVHPRCGGRMLLDLDVRRRDDDDNPTTTVENVPATRSVVMAATYDDVTSLVVIVRTGGRTDVGCFNVNDPDRRLFLNIVE